MSRSMMPLPRCSAPAACAACHSLSSRTSINCTDLSAAKRDRVSSTVTSRMRLLASFTSFRKPSECFMMQMPDLVEVRTSDYNACLLDELRKLSGNTGAVEPLWASLHGRMPVPRHPEQPINKRGKLG